ncbi:DUF4366 domain-containing protein [Peptostreptococcus faecalis]|uniref:DUF4366 domain-containing protein n=1 Tax=Peptostreptococcus faecalis TaxID=2045015 RepID=UPI000C7AF895|nr:DUF4366 domain-containing protein [Peptostreptococcus faecalis]
MKKNKLIRTCTVLMATLMMLGGFSVTAYAGGGEETTSEPEPTPEVTSSTPLTPEGNLTLVDDIEGEADEDKQFITVVSKNGNYFYIIVDRAAEGENTVHFLNLVDEADLMALMEEGQSTAPVAPLTCTCTDKCEHGAVNMNCPTCKTDTSTCTGKEAVVPEEPEPEQKSGSPLAIIFVVLVLAGGGAFYYFKIMKPKQDSHGGTTLDDLDFEDDEYEDEDTELELFEEDSEQEDE